MLVGEVVMLKRPSAGDEVWLWRDNVDEFWNGDGDSPGRVWEYEKVLANGDDSVRLQESRDCVFRTSVAPGLPVCDLEIL